MWKGPEVDGVSQSMIPGFLENPYTFYIEKILGLKETEEFQPNLCYGDCYHKGLEILIKTLDFPLAVELMLDHLYEKHPGAPPTFKYSLPKLLRTYPLENITGSWTTEDVFDELIEFDGIKIRCRGKRDGTCLDHPDYIQVMAEHKCKGYIDPGLTKDEILSDFQCNYYLKFIPGTTEWVFYDLIKIPDVQKYGPSYNYGDNAETWVDRIFTGPIGSYNNQYPINRYKRNWRHQIIKHFPVEEQEEYWETTIQPILTRIHHYYNWVTQSGFDMDNPRFYNELFYKPPVRMFQGNTTEKFKCKYHSLLIGETTLDDLEPIDSHFSELEDE